MAAALPMALSAQQSSQFAVASDGPSVRSSAPASAAMVASSRARTASKPLTARWLDLTTFSHSERYRNQYGDDGQHYFEDGQQRSVVAGRLKFDEAGKYFIGFRASSGRSFNWAYADYAGCGFACSIDRPAVSGDFGNLITNTGEATAYYADPAGVALVTNINSQGWEFYIRELYFSATPVQPVTVEFGSFAIEKGFSTEITSFDDDGYITGERIRLNDPKHLFFDQVTLTSAFFGYFDQPNLFDRGPGFRRSNYRQVAGRKQLSKRVGISGEWNWISNNARSNTTREAIVVDIHESKIFDKFRLEGYEMNSVVSLQGDRAVPRQGFALTGEKKVGKLSGDFGFASIDRNYGIFTGSSFMQEVGFSLNGDNYNTGIRIFTHLNYKLTPVITAFGFYTRITGQDIPNINTQGLNAGLSFDLKALANTEKRVF